MSLSRDELKNIEVKGQDFPANRALAKALALKFNMTPISANPEEYIARRFITAIMNPTIDNLKQCGFADRGKLLDYLKGPGARLFLRALAEAYLQTSSHNFHESYVNDLYRTKPPILNEMDDKTTEDPLFRLGQALKPSFKNNTLELEKVTNQQIENIFGKEKAKQMLKLSLKNGFYSGNTEDKNMEIIYQKWLTDTTSGRVSFQQSLESSLTSEQPVDMESKYTSPVRESKISIDDTDEKKPAKKTIPIFNRNGFFTDLSNAKNRVADKEKTWAELSSNFEMDTETKTMRETEIKQNPLSPAPITRMYNFGELKEKIAKDTNLSPKQKDKWNLICKINTPLSKEMTEALDHKLAWILQEEELKKFKAS